jgi:hypothetical protein
MFEFGTSSWGGTRKLPYVFTELGVAMLSSVLNSSHAVQMNIFSDFFLRVGQFYENIQKFKGTGWGVSWMGPRFGVEFGQKHSKQFSSGNFFFKDEKITDTGFSAIIKF